MAMLDRGLSGAVRAAGAKESVRAESVFRSNRFRTGSAYRPSGSSRVDAVTGIERTRLEHDPYGGREDVDGTAVDQAIDEIATARAGEYALLSVLLVRAPNQSFLDRLAELNGDASPLGVAHAALAEAARAMSAEQIEREYFDLFIGTGRGELLPYGSYYLTGFLNERPLARLRADLAEIGIAKAAGNVEPEDHIAVLCEVMARIAGGRFSVPAGAEQLLFEKHLAPWAGHFFADLERAESADFYRCVGTLGRTFINIETEAFALPA
jgi:TorA maturation chaperone TorD